MTRTAVKTEAGVASAATIGNGNGHSPASTIRQIALSEISVSMLEPQVRRREHFKPTELKELADSILSMGLISPITVRPIFHAELSYELVAGERRYLATKLAGLDTIEAVVRDLNDQQTIEIQLHENLKRLEIEPLDEAFSYKYLIDHAQILEGGLPRPYTVADIAAKFSRTEQIILRRLKLVDLIEDGRKDLSSGKLPLAHAETIASFPAKAQQQLLKNNVYNWNGYPVAYKELQSAIQSKVVRNLKAAPFDIALPVLHPEGLVCGDCKERSGYSPKLFDGDIAKVDHCLNGSCFEKKTLKALQMKREEIAAGLPNKSARPLSEVVQRVPLIRDSWGDKKPLGPGVYLNDSSYDAKFKKVNGKKACEFTELALYVETDKIGKTQYICRSISCKVHKTKKPSTSGSPDYSLKYKQEAFDRDVIKAVSKDAVAIALKDFSETKWISDSPEGRKMLLVVLYKEAGYRGREILKSIDGLSKPAKDLSSLYHIPEIRKAVEKLAPAEVSIVLAAFAYSMITEDAVAVQKLCADQKLNYKLADATARRKLAPADQKALFKEYEDKIFSGKAAARPSGPFWPKPKKQTKSSAKKPVKKVKGAKK